MFFRFRADFDLRNLVRDVFRSIVADKAGIPTRIKKPLGAEIVGIEESAAMADNADRNAA